MRVLFLVNIGPESGNPLLWGNRGPGNPDYRNTQKVYPRNFKNANPMSDHPHYTTLREIIRPYLPEDIDPGTISPESHLVADLNINSAHLVDIVLDVEDRFDIRLEDADMQEMATVAEALRVIDSKLENPGE